MFVEFSMGSSLNLHLVPWLGPGSKSTHGLARHGTLTDCGASILGSEPLIARERLPADSASQPGLQQHRLTAVQTALWSWSSVHQARALRSWSSDGKVGNEE